MKVLVTGGREYKGRKFLSDELWKIHEATPITTLIHGGARGADRLAGDWGRNRKTIEVISVPADWNRYGKKAGALPIWCGVPVPTISLSSNPKRTFSDG
jgi:hypothetical protein